MVLTIHIAIAQKMEENQYANGRFKAIVLTFVCTKSTTMCSPLAKDVLIGLSTYPPSC